MVYRAMRKGRPAMSSTGCVITSLARPRALRLAGIAAGAVAVAASAFYVTASAAGYSFNLGGSPSGTTRAVGLSTASESAATSAVCSDFMNHFTADLGSSQSKVDAAFQQAIAETLADQVKAGKLTQAQADAIKQKLAGKQPCSIGSALSPHPGAGGNAAAFMRQLLPAAASALGITPDQLKTDLGSGMSLSQIAAAHKPPITEDQFRSKLITALKPLLDQAVTSKQLTAQQEQKILARLQSGPIPFWDKAPKKPATGSSPTTTANSTS
jgi:hypothetical protein